MTSKNTSGTLLSKERIGKQNKRGETNWAQYEFSYDTKRRVGKIQNVKP